MNVIIIGDKFQKGMKSKGCVGLININRSTIIHHQYKIIKNTFPQANIIYVYGFEGKKLVSFIDKNYTYKDLTMIYNKCYESHNASYSLFLAKEFLNEECLLMFGDNILHSKTFNNFSNLRYSQVFINNKQKNKLGCIINNNKIENISYDLNNYLSGIYFLSKSHANTIKNLIENQIYHNFFIFEMVNKLIDMNQNICPVFANYKTTMLNRI